MENREASESVFQNAESTSQVIEGDALGTGSTQDAVAKAKAATHASSASVKVPSYTHNAPSAHTHRGTHADKKGEEGKPLTAENESWWRWTWRNAYNALVAMSQTFYTTGEAMQRRQAPDTKIIEATNNSYWAAPPSEKQLKQHQSRGHAALKPSEIPEGEDTDDIDQV